MHQDTQSNSPKTNKRKETALHFCWCLFVLLVFGIPISAYASSPGNKRADGISQTCQTDERNKDLFAAIGQRDSERVKALLATGVSPNARSEINYDYLKDDGTSCATALMHAARIGDVKTVQVLLASKADVKATDGSRLVWAYAIGYTTILHVVKELKDTYGDVETNLDARLKEEMDSRLQLTRVLLAAGAPINTSDPGNWNETALYRAVDAAIVTGDLRLLKTLIAAGARVNSKDNTILGYAIVMATLSESRDKTWAGKDPGAPAVIKVLIDAGANVNAHRGESSPLLLAAQWSRSPGSVKVLKLLLAARANVNARDGYEGQTPLLAALGSCDGIYPSCAYRNAADAGKDQIEAVKSLLGTGADPNLKNEKGYPPLHAAGFLVYDAYKKDQGASECQEVFKTLIAGGADINALDAKGNTFLSLLLSNRNEGHPEAQRAKARTVKLLIENGANVNSRIGQGQTLLFLALSNANDEVVQALVAAKANVNVRNNDGSTPLLVAAGLLRSSSIRVLVQAGAHVDTSNRNGQTPLMAAIRPTWYGSYVEYGVESSEIIRLLINAKANLNAKGPHGDTVLMLVAREGRDDGIVRELIAAGANVNARNAYGDTALILAARRFGSGGGRSMGELYFDTVSNSPIKALIAAGANAWARNQSGESALTIMATKSGDDSVAITRELIDAEKHGNYHPGVADLLSAIKRAAGNSSSDIVQTLIAAGANVNGLDEDRRPVLIVAVSESGNAAVVRALLKAGARVDEKDENGNTALISAILEYLLGDNEIIKNAMRRDPQVIRALLAAGADVGVQNKEGATALALALKTGNQTVIELLNGGRSQQQ